MGFFFAEFLSLLEIVALSMLLFYVYDIKSRRVIVFVLELSKDSFELLVSKTTPKELEKGQQKR